MKYIFFLFLRRIGLLIVGLTVQENMGKPENYRFMRDYEYQEKKEGNLLKCKVFEIYAYVID
jgi:hypothetical protein